MNDTTLLYIGVFCFAMTLLGLALTILEFRRISASRSSRNQPQTDRTPATSDARLATARAS